MTNILKFAVSCCVIFALVNSFQPSVSVADSDWPQWRGPNRDGISTETGLLPDWKTQKPRLVWKTDGLGKGFAGISIANGIIYSSGNFPDGQAVVALREQDGRSLWKRRVTISPPKHGYDGSRTTPAIDGRFVYAIPSDGSIACMDAKSGKAVWRKGFQDAWKGQMMSQWGFSESPLVDGDRVICTPGGPSALMVALDKTSGREIWRCPSPRGGGNGKDGAGYSSVVISEGAGVKQYVQLAGRGLIGVRASDGKLLWTYNRIANSTANIPTPIPSGDYVFCSTGYQTGTALVKLSPAAGGGVEATEEYFLPANVMQNHHGGMVLIDGYVYAGTGHGKGFPICVELKTGKVAWGGKIRGAGGGSAAVTCADGKLIFRYESGVVALIEATPQEYRLLGEFTPAVTNEPCWAHPVVCNGNLYLRDQDTLMCYRLAASQ